MQGIYTLNTFNSRESSCTQIVIRNQSLLMAIVLEACKLPTIRKSV